MLLYISSNENIGIFDFLSDEQGMVIKKLSGTFSLKQFVIYDMRSLNHYSYVAIDLKSLKDSQDEIIEAIIAFKSMFSSRLIFYIENIEENEILIERLIDQGIYNILSAENVEELNEEIQKATSASGMTKRDIERKLNKSNGKPYFASQYLFEKKDIKIAITGAIHKAGTTTMAIGMCNYLASIGASVCYVEANDHNHIQKLPNAYKGMIVKEDSIFYNGVNYLDLNANNDEEYDFVIYDMGVVERKLINAINNKCDVAILCATAKPYEIEDYDKAVQLLDNEELSTIFSFVAENEKRRLEEQCRNVYFAEYAPDLFDGDANGDVFREILKEYIIET